MANTQSPTRFNGEADSFFDPNFSLDINKKMRVPKSIRVNGDYDDDMSGMNGNSWNNFTHEKLEMHVPDRILVAGQEQHIGTKAPLREMAMENSVLISDHPVVRCITPPRVLTLDNHYFPTADEEQKRNNSVDFDETPVKPLPADPFNDSIIINRNMREQTPAYGVLDTSLPPGEEVQHLRRIIGKLNRRIMSVESELQQQQQKMKIIYITAAVYIFCKTMYWMGRN